MIVVFSPGGCIKIRSTKVFKMAVILDADKILNFLELSDYYTYLGLNCA